VRIVETHQGTYFVCKYARSVLLWSNYMHAVNTGKVQDAFLGKSKWHYSAPYGNVYFCQFIPIWKLLSSAVDTIYFT